MGMELMKLTLRGWQKGLMVKGLMLLLGGKGLEGFEMMKVHKEN